MKAIIFRKFGGPEVLESTDLPKPVPKDGEVLVKVLAAGVNPVDYKVRSGSFAKDQTKLPAVLGRDIAGVVEAVGDDMDGIKPGDPVYAFLADGSGGYAEFAIAKKQEVAAKPTALDYVHAAAVPLAATTAWQALFDHGGLQPGQRVLIHGAAGGVGHFAVQFAKAKGAVVITTASRQDAKFLKELGADEVIDHHKERFEESVTGIDLVVDLVAGETQDRSWSVLKEGGILVSTLGEPPAEKATQHHVRAKGFMAEPKREQLTEFARMIDDGKVRVVVQETFLLDEAARAHEELERRHSTGKLVLKLP